MVIGELRAAWTREQDALESLQSAESRAAALREIIAIHQARDTELPPLAETTRQAREAVAAAQTRLQHTSAAVRSDAEQIREAMLTDWDAQRPAATAAAQTVEAGTGRFGQHRARVAAARQDLDDWAGFWQPYLPAMPTNPDAVTRFALWWDNRPAHAEAFDRYAHHWAAELRPEHAAAHTALERARSVVRQDDTAYNEAAGHYSGLLMRRGAAARTPDPDGTLRDLNHDITAARARLDTARTTLTRLEQDPALRTAPPDTVTRERDRWTRDRHDAHEQAEQAARALAQAAHIAQAAHVAQARLGFATDLAVGTGYATPRTYEPSHTPNGPYVGM